jgi:hypothetical protein
VSRAHVWPRATDPSLDSSSGSRFFLFMARWPRPEGEIPDTLTRDFLLRYRTEPERGNAAIYWIDAGFIARPGPGTTERASRVGLSSGTFAPTASVASVSCPRPERTPPPAPERGSATNCPPDPSYYTVGWSGAGLTESPTRWVSSSSMRAMVLWVSALLLVTGAASVLGVRCRVRRQRLRVRQRRVELPNSCYSTPAVRRLMLLERRELRAPEQRDTPDGDGLDCLLRSLVGAGTHPASTSERRVLHHAVGPR